MSFFSDLFRKVPRREKCGEISTAIAMGLEHVRALWWKKFIVELEHAPIPIKLEQKSLGGTAELAIKAFQLLEVSSFLRERKYIPQSEGRDFADLVWAQVCGTEIDEVMRYVYNYDEVREDFVTFHARFGGDIDRYITGREARPEEAIIVTVLAPLLTSLCQIVVANAFGDEATARNLDAAWRRYLENISSPASG